MSIINIQPLRKIIIPILNTRPIISLLLRNRERQLPVGARTPIQDIHKAISRFLSGNTCPNNSNDIRQRKDRFENQRSHAMDHDDGGLARVGDGRHEPVAVVPGIEIQPVASGAFDGLVAFARVGVDEYDGGCGCSGGAGACAGVVCGGGCEGGAVYGSLCFYCIERGDEILVARSANALFGIWFMLTGKSAVPEPHPYMFLLVHFSER